MRTVLHCALLAGLFAASTADGQVYRWQDAEGRPHFTTELHEVPPTQRGEAERAAAVQKVSPGALPQAGVAPASIAPAPPARATTSRGGTTGRVYTIEVERAGTSMIVGVRLNDRVTAPFLIDTGATDVLVPQAVADQLGLKVGNDTRRVRYQTANGVVESPVVTLESVDLGGARVEGVPASISPSLGIGLLGLSFFNHFTYEIDAAAGLVKLRPNDLAEKGLIRGGRSEAQWRAEFASLEGRRVTVEAELDGGAGTRGRERARLQSLLSDVERDLGLLTGEADAARVPFPWRQ